MTEPVDAPRKTKVIRLQTVGCRLNQYETERMAAKLYPFGFRRAADGEPADLTVINTCTVTHRADADCRRLIRQAARRNPHGRIVVVGCYVDHDPEVIAGLEGVDVIVPNRDKDAIDRILPARLPDLFREAPDLSCSPFIEDFHNRNRAWVKISDGCNQWCSFCIVAIVRGRLANRPAADIAAEINALAAQGYREIVLTGVNIGYYRDRGREPQIRSLAGLCRFLLAETDLARLRLSSVEPQAVKDDLIEVFAESRGRLCRHFHLPLQSASSEILCAMRRPYNQAIYVQRASRLKAAVPGTTIGADVIVGFPGETEEHFEQTRRLAASGLIDYLHVFSYSDRPGTAAAALEGKVPAAEVRRRNRILADLSRRLQRANLERQVGRTLEVIAEHRSEPDGAYFALSDNYLRVKLPASAYRERALVPVAVTAAREDYLEGIPVGSPAPPA
ncbi:MAG TPA: tRNA (N(6)-L-threonylcarbamoyladenosine(37)-C(2))-methylthiotransferase MtaB [candidate division Zixibacteria bacterium]|nr:tRNA (N(6)-L-threonylcarbamoyladenosine(37)-C(2))-methylthiotransferase MtaB [candidate division Zixibacteria bacterium]MDD4916389.1 tRNA (N(6)-L-threonylcarbamoyladenosine(37)-C(2))-methylthiotransferase MtaB [candidate division Zixibacteria bacterium]MDM7972849.1 tRNA (N(6)-L-threonylcarbamoyladenosine(37)-C(2))-methylthiotransferase MtaB [candidate division Zixibacteria bacterium]HOD65686.1 tRNA (N(6)-L-threonylcarbamoyladenosine(37)-C(2))-methylthiotransferase MtaB [candidate division Zix